MDKDRRVSFKPKKKGKRNGINFQNLPKENRHMSDCIEILSKRLKLI